MRKVLFVAGEASGDLHAAGVAASLRRIRPELELAAIGGAKLAEQGVEMIHLDAHLGVMGFFEILEHIPAHFRLLGRITDMMRRGELALIVLIDYPGFNMKVAERAKEFGVPVLYYVTPQVWAWGSGRLPKLARLVTKAAVILPFEEKLLRGYGVDATFVGHPMLDRAVDMPSKAQARAELGIPDDAEVLALFPGSRQQEIERHLDDFVAAANMLCAKRPGLRVLVSVAETVKLDPSRCPFPLVHSQSLNVLRAADAGLCKSGTTTLEAAIAGCPLVVAYRTGRISYALARMVVTVPHIGLVNVVAGREVAPEFIQDDIKAKSITAALTKLLDAGPAREKALAGLAEVKEKLGSAGAADRVSAMASAMLP
ncbi:MAG: lipid-A-disaccharide synthase [Gemmatimonadaceae bacterium]|nr:lipid-A-disaccharide synthase [Gemmatimonadaceae bacterium]